MKTNLRYITLLAFCFLLLFKGNLFSCSGFKITQYGKTMFGNNEDAWLPDSRIWFETPKPGKYGCVFFGFQDMYAQGGMNEYGLCFDGFTIASRELKIPQGKKQVQNTFTFIMDIMKTCKTVNEVKKTIEQYDYTYLSQGMLFFVDKLGNYLVVEPDTMLLGNDPKYVLSNFCPSQINDLNTVNIKRYQRGRRYLSNMSDTSFSFCTSVMDTMHVCRKGLGDGTMYTNIFDTKEGIIYLYFYHDFKHVVKFTLKDEFRKGDHVLPMSSLFPKNKEFEELLEYKTPLNTKSIFWAVVICTGLFFVTAVYFLFSYIILLFRKKEPGGYKGLRIVLSIVSMIMLACTFYLVRDKAIVYLGFYPDVPLVSIYKLASFAPLIIAIAFVPLATINWKIFKRCAWRFFPLALFTLNNIVYLICIVMFAYWGLYKFT